MFSILNSQLKIVYPSEKDKWSISDLWQDSFNDSPEYIEFFFNRVYKSENTLVIKRNDFIVSMLQMIPYKAKLAYEILPVAYVYGACTHPFERGQGLMKELICFAKSEMYRRGFAYAIVIPANLSLFDYYRKLGFTSPIFHHIEHKSYNKVIVDFIEKKYPFTFEDCSTNKHFQYFLCYCYNSAACFHLFSTMKLYVFKPLLQ